MAQVSGADSRVQAGGDAAFVGRTRELAELRLAWQRAAAGTPEMVLVRGEPGVGKSRLVAEFAAGLEDAEVLRGAGWEGGAMPSLHAWSGIFADLRAAELATPLAPRAHSLRRLEEAARVEPALEIALGDLSGPGTTEPLLDAASSRRVQLVEQVRCILQALSLHRPLLVVVDDIQWSDSVSIELLRALGSAGSQGRVLAIGVTRPAVVGAESLSGSALVSLARSAIPLDLGGLSEAECIELAEAAGVEALSRDHIERIASGCGGNPFFLLESLKSGAAEGQVPRGVRSVILARARALGAEISRSLSIAALVGGRFEVGILAQAIGGGDRGWRAAFRAVDAGREAGLLDSESLEGQRYGFRHALVRESLAEALTMEDAAAVHARIAVALSGNERGAVAGQASRVVHHLRAAGPHGNPAEVSDWARRAADEALASRGYAEAAQFFSVAADAAGQTGSRERRGALLVEASRAALWPGETVQSAEWLREATEIAEATDSLELRAGVLAVEVARMTWRPAYRDPASADALVERARRVLAEPSGIGPDLRCRLVAGLVPALGHAGRLDEIGPVMAEASSLAEHPGVSPETRGIALLLSGGVFKDPRGQGLVLERAAEVLELGRRSGDPLLAAAARALRAPALLAFGNREGAVLDMAEVGDFSAQLQLPIFTELHRSFSETTALLAGRLEDLGPAPFPSSLSGGGSAPTFPSRDGLREQVGFCLGSGPLAERARGRHAAMLGWCERLPALVAERSAVMALRLLLHAESGEDREAHEWLPRVLAAVVEGQREDPFRAGKIVFLADAVAELDAGEVAEQVIAELRPLAEFVAVNASGTVFGSYARPLGRLQALLGDFAGAADSFTEAVGTEHRMGADFCLAMTRRDMAAAFSSAAKRIDGITVGEHRQQAEEFFLRIGADFFAGPRPARRQVVRASPPVVGGKVARPAGRPDQAARWQKAGGGQIRIVLGEHEVRVRANKGLRYLECLLLAPYREMHVFELIDAVEGSVGKTAPVSGSGLEATRGRAEARADGRAVLAYRNRLAELEELRDPEGGLPGELEEEVRFLREAVVRQGPKVAPEIERARKSVGNRLRAAIARLLDYEPEIGRHFLRSLDLGSTCVYRPAEAPAWEFEDG